MTENEMGRDTLGGATAMNANMTGCAISDALMDDMTINGIKVSGFPKTTG